MEIDKDVNKNGECICDQQQQKPKKQSRRRLHCNKPYQERFLNMSEARKEIATALKFHRASMKQQQTEHEWKSIFSSTATTNYRGPYSYFPSHWPISTIVPPPPPLLTQEDVNFVLPNQTLGLNLNFQDFDNLNTIIYHKPMPVYSPSTSTSVAKEAVIVPIDSHEEEGDGYDHPFEQVMEFPPWLNNSNDHHFSHEYSPDPDPVLPCMDIGEIEGMDGEWLA